MLLLAALLAGEQAMATEQQAAAESLDWVPAEAMPAEQRAALPRACCGAFIDGGGPGAAAPPGSGQTAFTAAEGFRRSASGTINIDGKVTLRQGLRTIRNNGATIIDSTARTFTLEGEVAFREPGMLLRGNAALFDNGNDASTVEAARYVLHGTGIHGSAEVVIHDGASGRITISDGEFSRCEPVDPFWTLAAEKMTLHPEQGQGSARDLRLRFGDVTVFRYPFAMRFPLGDQRVSGLLPPSIGSSRSGGFDLALPYYLDLAPHYDATITPRLISDRGAMLGAEFRYLARSSMNTLRLSWLGDDRSFEPDLASIPGSGSPPAANRWFASFRHDGSLGEHWQTLIDFTAVSDRDWFTDLAAGGFSATAHNHLNRQARLRYRSRHPWGNLRAELDVQRIELIDPLADSLNIAKPHDRLPHLRLSGDFELGANFRFALAGQLASFDRKLDASRIARSDIDNGALVTGRRLNLSPRLEWSWQAPGAFLRATASHEHVRYQLERQALGSPANPSLGMTGQSIDGGLVFQRQRAGGKGLQTLEPRLFYRYRQYREQRKLPVFDSSELNFGFRQLFRERRFSGGDRFADANELGVAVTSRVFDDAGRERGRFSLGQVRHFRDRLVSLSSPLRQWQPLYSPVDGTSALVGELEYRHGANWRFSGDVQWNEHHRSVDEGSIRVRYQGERERVFNLSWRYRSLLQATPYLLQANIEPNINQTEASAAWPLAANWTLLARWHHDHANSRNLEAFAGVEYRNCCTTIRLIAREWLDEHELFVPNVGSNRGVFVQVSLHGVGNLAGGGLSDLLSDGIQGFKDADHE